MLPPFPVDDEVLDLVEDCLQGGYDERFRWVGSEFNLNTVLDFYSGYDPSKVVEEYGFNVYKGEMYTREDVILALINEVRRLRNGNE